MRDFFSFVSYTINSQSKSTFVPAFALTWTTGTLPPLISRCSPAFSNSYSISYGFASGRSILLIATTAFNSIFKIKLITSIVWFLTPYVAATTSTTKSVMFAPLYLILIKASWPGVSMKVICLSPCLTLKAPILWVIPPCYLAAILEFLK